MKVLLTGASGFLGQHIVSRLSKEGIDIVAVVRPTSETSHLKSDRLKLIYGDLRDEGFIKEAIVGVDVVVHAATSKGGAWKNYYEENVKSTELLLKASQDHAIKRFIYVSSVMVYDHSSAQSGKIFEETSPYEKHELTNYSKSKIAAEKIVQQYHQNHRIPTVVIRPVGLYGTGGLLYPARLGLAAGKNRYIIVGDKNTPLPLSHVESVAEAIWRCIQNENCIGKSYNIVEDEPITRWEFLRTVKDIFNPKLSIIRVPYPVMQFLEFIVNNSMGLIFRKTLLSPLKLKLAASTFYYANAQAKHDLGWAPKTDVKTTVEEMMAWHRKKRTPKRNFSISRPKSTLQPATRLQVGIVGCGMFSETHLSILARLKHAEVVAVCDPDENARKSVSSKFGISNTYSGLEEMLANEKIDVVHLLTPAQDHAELSIAAMKHGCHVLVEKPMALNAREARRMVKIAKEKKVKLCIDHNHLYDGVMIKTRELIADGSLGRIAHVEAWYGTSYSSNADNRYLSFDARNHWVYQLPGSLYQNMISHPLSLLLDVMGTVSGVKASAKYLRIVPHMKNDELRVLLENDNMLGTLTLSLGVSPRYNILNVYGTKATLKVDFLNKSIFLDKIVPMAPKVIGRNLMNLKQAMTLVVSTFKNGFNVLRGKFSIFEGNEKLIQLFYDSILLDEEPPVSLEEGLQSMEIMDEIWSQLGIGKSNIKSKAKKKEAEVAEYADAHT